MLHFYDLYNYITAFLWQLIFSECSTILLLGIAWSITRVCSQIYWFYRTREADRMIVQEEELYSRRKEADTSVWCKIIKSRRIYFRWRDQRDIGDKNLPAVLVCHNLILNKGTELLYAIQKIWIDSAFISVIIPFGIMKERKIIIWIERLCRL